VLASILLAFWIDAWWDERQDRLLEAEILDLVAAEVEANRAELRSVLTLNEEALADIDRFFRVSPNPSEQAPRDSVRSMIRALQRLDTFNPNEEAASLLARTPVVGPGSLRRRTLIARYLQEWADAAEEHPTLKQRQNDVMGHLARYAGREADSGREAIPAMVARRGGAVLGELRRDEELVATVAQKAHWQNVYQNELREVLAALDSASVAFQAAVAARSR
jgi:hypothetical protein